MRNKRVVCKPSSQAWWVWAVSVLLISLFVTVPAEAQETQQTTTTGIVTSVTRTTLLLRTEDNQFRLFTIDRNTTKPTNLPIGSTVDVRSSPTDDPGVRLANVVTMTKTAAGTAAVPQDNVPASVRHAEQALKREARYVKFGFQGGFTLDPELVAIGVHAKFGPIFNPNLYFRPSGEFEYGEVTKLFGINADLIYKLPLTTGRKYVYFGGGPAFNFVEQSFTKNVSFSEFKYDAALNILLGFQFSNGVFTEVKTSVYADPAPIFHLTVGYTF